MALHDHAVSADVARARAQTTRIITETQRVTADLMARQDELKRLLDQATREWAAAAARNKGGSDA